LLYNLEEWKFSYWDATAWLPAWSEVNSLPKAVKISFKLTGDKETREMTIDVPVG